ncbi:hypothetical protein NMG60_11031910 [Bertholletia excelsa]
MIHWIIFSHWVFQSNIHWQGTEKWLQQRYRKAQPGHECDEHFTILGYQWRTLRFNDNTHQSTVKIMAACGDSDPGSVYIMQQAYCLVVPSIWKDIHGRLFFFESDAEIFIINTTNHYDMVFIDAHDEANVFHLKLWDPHLPFLKALEKHLHRQHGIVVVNLHSDSNVLDLDGFVSSILHQVLPMGNSGVSGGILEKDLALNALMSEAWEIEKLLNLTCSYLEYVKGGFTLVD